MSCAGAGMMKISRSEPLRADVEIAAEHIDLLAMNMFVGGIARSWIEPL